MNRPWGPDILGVLRGLQMVVNAGAKQQEKIVKKKWANSSVKELVEQNNFDLENRVKTILVDSKNVQIDKQFIEILQRLSMVFEGIKGYVVYSQGASSETNGLNKYNLSDIDVAKEAALYENLIKQQVEQNQNLRGGDKVSDFPEVSRNLNDLQPVQTLSHEDKIEYSNSKSKFSTIDSQDLSQVSKRVDVPVSIENKQHNSLSASNVEKKPKQRQTLSEISKQRTVPSSRIGRMFSFGTLAAGLGIGTIAEITRRSLGLHDSPSATSLDKAFLTPANAQRIVNTLCKVRGAALKIGQILSIQDNNVISPELQQAFERVRQAADFMPSWQVEKVLESEFGPDWRSKVDSFEMKPFAAASIGQVHYAVLKDGTEVAVKIQYPGVAKGIESDINNLVSVMKIWNVFPQGMFIDNVVEVAKRELSWEVDYEREKECTIKFKELLKPYPEYHVPDVIDELCSKQVFTTSLIEGVPVDKCVDMDEATRKHICYLVMQLCLRELFTFKYMQTDPNWSNFFYNPETKQLVLLDFGASRSYDSEFLDQYVEVIKAAADGDRNQVLKLSQNMGFLTGFESKVMEESHVDAVMILGEVFSERAGEFDFGGQTTTAQIQKLVPTIITHRLCPPPEEIYSLHRKLSGVFLLCAKLKVKMACRQMFLDIYKSYKKGA